MILKFVYLNLLVFLLLSACSNKDEKVSVLKEKNLETQMIELYNEAMKEFERGDVIYAGKKFSEAELMYPQSIWAPRAVLMSAYGYFSQGYYSDAIISLINSNLYLESSAYSVSEKLFIINSKYFFDCKISFKSFFSSII